MSNRRTLMGAQKSGSAETVFKKATYSKSVTGSNTNSLIYDVDIDVNKIVFCHWYDDNIDEQYTTAGTSYEGWHPGIAGTYCPNGVSGISNAANINTWQNWRTHATNGQTGYYATGSGTTFQSDKITISANPYFKGDHTYVLEVFYKD